MEFYHNPFRGKSRPIWYQLPQFNALCHLSSIFIHQYRFVVSPGPNLKSKPHNCLALFSCNNLVICILFYHANCPKVLSFRENRLFTVILCDPFHRICFKFSFKSHGVHDIFAKSCSLNMIFMHSTFRMTDGIL